MRYHALWNGVYTATANRTGREDRGDQLFEYIGRSIIYSPDGKILTEAPQEREGIYAVEINLSLAQNKQLNPYNNKFQDRQPIFYFDNGLT
jgi:predicted amidohydrolase